MSRSIQMVQLHGRFTYTKKKKRSFFVYESYGRNGSLINGDPVLVRPFSNLTSL